MKKILLTTLIGTALASSAMAQGTLLFDNYVDPSFIALIYGPETSDPTISKSGQSAADVPSGGTVYTGGGLQGSRYTAQLWAGPAGTTDPTLLSLVTSSTFYDAASGAPAGVIIGANGTVTGVGAGQTAVLQVRVFDTQSGSTYANAGVKGSSALFNSGPLGGSDAGGTLFFPPETTGWQSFNIFSASAVPEPSTFALAGLGAAAFLILRRRK